MHRRGLLTASGAATLAACSRPTPPAAGDVLAAGQPAALLIWAVAPRRLAGWPRRPAAAGLATLEARAADLPELGALTTGGAPANLEAVARLRPSLVIDYGDTADEHSVLARRLQARLGAPWRLIDGALARTPQAFRTAGALLDATRMGERLGDAADRVLADWRSSPAGPSFYYARGSDGLETAFTGALATEVLEGAGWTNAAVGGRDVGRISREQVAAWDPEAVITLDPALAGVMADDPFWRRRRNGTRRRLLLVPDTPFGWIDRPPSVNRLLGCAWLGGAGPTETRMLAKLIFDGPGPGDFPRWVA